MKYLNKITLMIACLQICKVVARKNDYRLADLMCEKYKTNHENISASSHGFMVKGVILIPGLEIPVFVGVIISENSILTRFDFDDGPTSMELYQLGSVVVKSFHSNENDYHVVSKYYQLAETNFVLFKLKYGLNFHSNLYPLCLWHSNVQPIGLVDVSVFYAYVSNDEFTISQPGQFTGKILPDIQCHINETETEFCFEFTEQDGVIRKNILEQDWFVSAGIITFEYNATRYLWGLYLESFETEREIKFIGHRVSAVYDSIEKYVWLSFTKSLSVCGLRFLDRDVLYGAQNALKGEFPWHVAIYDQTGPRKKYICGGTIIDEQTILTAAHCIYDEYGMKKPQNIHIIVGISSLMERKLPNQKFTAHRLIQYPLYTINISANDIGSIQLNRSIEFNQYIQPICLTNDSSIFPLNYGTVVGWGQVKKGRLTNVLHRGDFKIRTDSNCIEVTSTDSVHIIDEYNFCAGYLNGTNVCIGDSGGGLVIPKYGIWYLYGIVSFFHKKSRETCAASKISIFTDVTKFYDWIQPLMYANRNM